MGAKYLQRASTLLGVGDTVGSALASQSHCDHHHKLTVLQFRKSDVQHASLGAELQTSAGRAPSFQAAPGRRALLASPSFPEATQLPRLLATLLHRQSQRLQAKSFAKGPFSGSLFWFPPCTFKDPVTTLDLLVDPGSSRLSRSADSPP